MKQVLRFLPATLTLLLTAAPLPILVFNLAGTNLAIAAERSGSNLGGKPDGRFGGKLEKLNLTDAQKAQMQQVRANSRQQFEAILTPEQRQQLEQARQNRQRPNLNLTDDQKARMKTLRQNTRSQIEAILTPEQRQQWQQMRETRQRRQPS